jgi:hypothetical protein
MKNINKLFSNQITSVLNGEIKDAHSGDIVKDVHQAIQDLVEEAINESFDKNKYFVQKERKNKLYLSHQKSDITIVDKETKEIVCAIEYSSARQSFVKNKSNNAYNLIGEAFNYSMEKIPLLWIFNLPAVVLEYLNKFDTYKDVLIEYLNDETKPAPKVKKGSSNDLKTLSINKIKKEHLLSFYKTYKAFKKDVFFNDVEILIGLIDYDYKNKTSKDSDFKNFANNCEVKEWLKDMNENFNLKIKSFVNKFISKHENKEKNNSEQS